LGVEAALNGDTRYNEPRAGLFVQGSYGRTTIALSGYLSNSDKGSGAYAALSLFATYPRPMNDGWWFGRIVASNRLTSGGSVHIKSATRATCSGDIRYSCGVAPVMLGFRRMIGATIATTFVGGHVEEQKLAAPDSGHRAQGTAARRDAAFIDAAGDGAGAIREAACAGHDTETGAVFLQYSLRCADDPAPGIVGVAGDIAAREKEDPVLERRRLNTIRAKRRVGRE